MRKGDATKARITDEAIKLFSSRGFEAVTFQMIAKKVGISQPALYVHYKNKDDIFCHAVLMAAERGRIEVDREINPHDSAREKLKAYILGNLRWVFQCRDDALTIIGSYYFSGTNPEILLVFNQIEKVGRSRIENMLSQGNHEKSWDVKNFKRVAQMINSLLVGEMFKAFHRREEYDLKDRLKTIWAGISSLVDF